MNEFWRDCNDSKTHCWQKNVQMADLAGCVKRFVTWEFEVAVDEIIDTVPDIIIVVETTEQQNLMRLCLIFKKVEIKCAQMSRHNYWWRIGEHPSVVVANQPDTNSKQQTPLFEQK